MPRTRRVDGPPEMPEHSTPVQHPEVGPDRPLVGEPGYDKITRALEQIFPDLTEEQRIQIRAAYLAREKKRARLREYMRKRPLDISGETG